MPKKSINSPVRRGFSKWLVFSQFSWQSQNLSLLISSVNIRRQKIQNDFLRRHFTKSNCVFGKAFSSKRICVWWVLYIHRYIFSSMCRISLSPYRLAGKINKCQSSCHLLHRRRDTKIACRSIFSVFFFLRRLTGKDGSARCGATTYCRIYNLVASMIYYYEYRLKLCSRPSRLYHIFFLYVLIWARNFVLRLYVRSSLGWFLGNDGSRWRC